MQQETGDEDTDCSADESSEFYAKFEITWSDFSQASTRRSVKAYEDVHVFFYVFRCILFSTKIRVLCVHVFRIAPRCMRIRNNAGVILIKMPKFKVYIYNYYHRSGLMRSWRFRLELTCSLCESVWHIMTPAGCSMYTCPGADGEFMYMQGNVVRQSKSRTYVSHVNSVRPHLATHQRHYWLSISGRSAADARRRGPNISHAPSHLHLQTSRQLCLFSSRTAVFHSTGKPISEYCIYNHQRKCTTKINVSTIATVTFTKLFIYKEQSVVSTTFTHYGMNANAG